MDPPIRSRMPVDIEYASEGTIRTPAGQAAGSSGPTHYLPESASLAWRSVRPRTQAAEAKDGGQDARGGLS